MSRTPFPRAAALAAAVCAAVLSTSPLAFAGPPPLPSDDDVQKLFDAKEYATAETALDRLIACRWAAAAHNDRGRDLQLLAECQLQLKQSTRLAKTLKAAIDHAEDEHDLPALGEAAELELLRRASIDWAYHPRTDRKASYDLLDPAQRSAAVPLVYAESLAGVTEAWRAARGKRELAPVVEVAATFALVRATEHAITGGTAETDKLGQDVERNAGNLVGQKLTTMAKEVANARRTAQQVVAQQQLTRNGRMRTVQVKRGLSAAELKGLKGVADLCDKMNAQVDAINRGLAAPLQLGGAGPTIDDVKQKATDLLSDLGAL